MEVSEHVQPLLPCASLEDTVNFYSALGFEVVQYTREPYPYVEVRFRDLWLHFSDLRVYGAKNAFSAFMVFVDDAWTYHQRFASGLRKRGGIPLRGLPRFTRMRREQTRFSLFDPTGNMLVFISRQEPESQTWGSEGPTSALMQALKNAAFLRDTYANDEAAARVLDKALERARSGIPIELARVLAARAELAVALGDETRARALEVELQNLSLSSEETERFGAELRAAADLRTWLGQSPEL